ncbi:DUF6056 family protein [Dysgonomonas sp. 511]|uniref:DUF3329 domain-containing protein n=1 Tax=Dysgonomonas sp. 511 TaxID=2302930 RepID=UPI0013D51C86|nr:DUF6056 family protein [Dysgonomonas sp. 511]NDV79139.1 hypothetical protein [Dysgonomonas sp. 511]
MTPPQKNSKPKSEKTIYKPVVLSILLLCIFSLAYLLNKLYPLYSDDWTYIYSNSTSVLSQIFDRLYQQYFEWGGRSVVHSIAHLLSWAGVAISDIVNSIAFALLTFLIYRICNKTNNTNTLLFAVLSLSFWLLLPVFSCTILWLVGAANYLWGTIIVISFLYFYYNYYISDKEYKGIFYPFIFFIFGIIAGWTNENMFIAEFFFIICTFLFLWFQNKKIPLWAVCGLIGIIIGGATMILAPGNYVRSEQVGEILGLADKSLFENIIYRILKAGYRYSIYILPTTLLYILLFYIYRKQQNGKGRKLLNGSLLFFLSGHIAWMAMMASPIFPPRAAFGIVTFIFIGCGILYANIHFENKKARYINRIIIGIITIVFASNYIYDYLNISYLSERFKEREEYVISEKRKGNKTIIFKEEIILPVKYDFEDLSDKPDYWLNKQYAAFYVIDSVKVLKQSRK